MNKEELIKELNQTIKDAKLNVKEFEKTHDFDYISDYNVYSLIEFFESIVQIISNME